MPGEVPALECADRIGGRFRGVGSGYERRARDATRERLGVVAGEDGE